MKRLLMFCMAILLMAGTFPVQAAQQQSNIMQKNNQMRENLTWFIKGIYDLGQSKDKKLALTKQQKKALLPFYQELIKQKLVVTELEQNQNDANRNNRGNETSGNNRENRQRGKGSGGQFQGGWNQDSPEMQARLKQMEDQINTGLDLIGKMEKVLTKEQIRYIDNIDFKPEDYGLSTRAFNFNRQSTDSGQGQGQRPDPKAMEEMRKKIQAGREKLVKLNKDVLKMLQP